MLSYSEGAFEIKADIENGRPPVKTEVVDLEPMEDVEAARVLNGIRPRLLEISAVFGDMAVHHSAEFRARFSRFGLGWNMEDEALPIAENMRPIQDGEIRTFENLGRTMKDTALASTFDFFRAAREDDDFELWYQEAEALLCIYRTGDRLTGTKRALGSPEMFIASGFATGVDTGILTLDLVDEAHSVFAPDAKDAEIAETARRAKRIPYKIAKKVPIEIMAYAIDALGNLRWNQMFTRATAFNLDRFKVVPDSKNPNVLNIKFGEDGLANPGDPEESFDSLPHHLDLLGCPGVMDFKDETDLPSHPADLTYLELVGLAGAMRLWHQEKRLAPTHLSL